MNYVDTIRNTQALARKIQSKGQVSRGADLLKNFAALQISGKLNDEQSRAVIEMARVIAPDDTAAEIDRKLGILLDDAADEATPEGADTWDWLANRL